MAIADRCGDACEEYDKLEKAIARNSKFPVPRLSPQKRIAYLKELRGTV